MPKVKAEYEQLNEFREIAKRLVSRYQDEFYGVEPDLIQCYAIINKSRESGQKKLWELKPVQMPIRLDCPYAYYVIVYLDDWDSFQDKHKYLLVAQVLHAIPVEDGEIEEGKVNSFDLKDYAPMIRTFGPDYLEKDNVPNILEENIEWEM